MWWADIMRTDFEVETAYQISDCLGTVVDRVTAGEGEYGESTAQRPVDEILREILPEIADSIAYAAMAARQGADRGRLGIEVSRLCLVYSRIAKIMERKDVES
jgi:hypothetical protein